MQSSSILTLSALFLLAGCGGGIPSANMPATSANAMQATRVSYAAALSNGGLGTLSSDTGVIAAGPGNVSKLGGDIAQSTGSGGQATGVPIPPTTSPCDGGGDVTISGDIADVITFNLSPNDFFVVDFNMCNDGLDYVVDAFSGNFLRGLYDLTMTMTLDSSLLSGVVQYSTPTMFAGFDVDYPHSGVFLVTGSDSSARLTALDNVNILIEIDSDGDGNIDDTINTTWAELESS